MRAEAVTAGSPINEVWARTVAAGILLRVDVDGAVPAIEEALAEARRIDYPAAVSANLRTLALAHISRNRLVDAARVLTELFDGLVARGALADLRAALHTTAVLLQRSERGSWANLNATAQSLSIVSMMAAVDSDLFPLPSGVGTALARRDAIVLVRSELRTLLDGEPAGEPAAPPVVASTAATSSPATFANRGDWWEVSFGGTTVHVKESKGLVDLARLLAAPDRELHCLELMGATVVEPSTGEVLDDVARRQYEERVRELQAEIDSAEADHDHARADRGRVELDTLDRPSHRGPRSRWSEQDAGRICGEGPIGGDATCAVDDPPSRRDASRTGPPPHVVDLDGHVLLVPAGAPRAVGDQRHVVRADLTPWG